MTIRVVIAEDQGMVLGALSALLEIERDIQVVGRAANGREALDLTLKHKPDVLISDIEMPEMSGLEVAAELKQRGSASRIVILTTFARPGYLRRALQAGATGYLLKDSPSAMLAEAVRRVHSGLRVVDPDLAAGACADDDPLTDRERQVLRLAAEGSTSGDIAEQLKLSEGTVRNYLSEAISKLGANNRVEAARIARGKGLAVTVIDDAHRSGYQKSRQYWANASPTVSTMLGANGHVHKAEIEESRAFIESLKPVGRERALDCGAGIGRVSKHLLCPLFKITDVLEPSKKLRDKAKAELPAKSIGEFIATSIEQVAFRHTYDVIAMNWVVAYLLDDDFASFLQRCGKALRPNGIVFIKDNLSTSRKSLLVDEKDNNLARTDKHYKHIFAESGMTCIKERRQRQWPDDLYPVKMYALRQWSTSS